MVYDGRVAERMKTQYLIKEFATLTGTTVRTLHHYDQIGLLRPSGRRPNGYRVYTQDDLLRLEQIIALKFLGLSLREIGRILKSPALTVEKSLRVQAGIIAEEARRLEGAARAVRQVIKQLETGKKVDIRKVIKIIQEIQMSEETKKNWAERFYTPEEMKEFEEIGRGYTPEQLEAYQKKWAALIEEVKSNLGSDPTLPVGQDLARRWQALFDEAYGGRPNLRKRIGEAYRSGAVPAEYQMISPEVWEFISKASSALGKKAK
jgi:DNA-binding transcriptional MerR regulator